jgi:seryl-tRNA synthetase
MSEVETKTPAEQPDIPAEEPGEKPNNIDALEAKNRELLDELRKARTTAKTFQSKIDEIEKKKQEEKGEYKDMYESTLEELKAIKTSKEELESNILESRKVSEVMKKIGRPLKKSEYVTFVDTGKIIYDEETHSFDPKSVEMVANGFLKEHGDLLVTKTVTLPSDSARHSSESISHEQWLKLPLKEKKEKRKFVKD